MVYIYQSPELALHAILDGRAVVPYQPSVPHTITEPIPAPSSTIYASSHALEGNEWSKVWNGLIKVVAATAVATVVALGFVEADENRQRGTGQIEQYNNYNNMRPGMDPYQQYPDLGR